LDEALLGRIRLGTIVSQLTPILTPGQVSRAFLTYPSYWRLAMSTARHCTTSERPAKPYPGFPLFPHATGRWAKKIRGKFHYFGEWSDPNGALRRYLVEKDDLEAGRKPRRVSEGVKEALTVRGMVGLFLDAKEINVRSGEMEQRTWKEYQSYGVRMIRVLGH
jgi:hypothetical protein